MKILKLILSSKWILDGCIQEIKRLDFGMPLVCIFTFQIKVVNLIQSRCGLTCEFIHVKTQYNDTTIMRILVPNLFVLLYLPFKQS